MSLEARVEALERDVAALRTETRGWATFAVSADQKAGVAGELLSLIRQDVNEIKQDLGIVKAEVAGHTGTLDEHTGMLREILSRLP